ncbi:MAG TPA: hypothetical protein VJ110_01000 [Candidatus Nanoarchaeia archaeon]|nr:hypothetical protein [Candidatus Nanoarchaeia archaeon]
MKVLVDVSKDFETYKTLADLFVTGDKRGSDKAPKNLFIVDENGKEARFATFKRNENAGECSYTALLALVKDKDKGTIEVSVADRGDAGVGFLIVSRNDLSYKTGVDAPYAPDDLGPYKATGITAVDEKAELWLGKMYHFLNPNALRWVSVPV